MNTPPDLKLDAEACDRVATLLALRPQVWERLPVAAAEKFDDVVLSTETVLGLLRSPQELEVDREGNLARWLEHIDAGVRQCRGRWPRRGERAFRKALAAAVTTTAAPVREHLANVWAAAHVPAGRNAIINLLPREYLIQCARCRNTAERLRVLPKSVSLTHSTQIFLAVSVPVARAPDLFATLEREGAGALCVQLERETSREVINYCPDCGALYCDDHYVTHTTWSGTWPDSVTGTCAKGHRRELL